MTRAHVESAALQLDSKDRARLVEVLVTSLAVERAVDDAWFEDIGAGLEAPFPDSWSDPLGTTPGSEGMRPQ